MSASIESGILRGRPFGGVAFIVKRSLRGCTETIYCCDRFAAIKLANYLIINVYLPCNGTTDRIIILYDILAEMQSLLDNHATSDVIIAGDFNADLDIVSSASNSINKFCSHNSLSRCDTPSWTSKQPTYINTVLNQESFSCLLLHV
jgi:exonuclease III